MLHPFTLVLLPVVHESAKSPYSNVLTVSSCTSCFPDLWEKDTIRDFRLSQRRRFACARRASVQHRVSDKCARAPLLRHVAFSASCSERSRHWRQITMQENGQEPFAVDLHDADLDLAICILREVSRHPTSRTSLGVEAAGRGRALVRSLCKLVVNRVKVDSVSGEWFRAQTWPRNHHGWPSQKHVPLRSATEHGVAQADTSLY